MRAIDRKVLRDLWHLRGQVLAIGMVVAAGIAALIMSLSTLEALDETTAAYYERYRFGDVFASVKRAPASVEQRIASIPGVRTVQTRVSQYATLDTEGFAEPVMGRFVSLPEGRQPILNQLALRSGRLPEDGADDEVALSPEFVYALGPGALMPDDRRFGILWMGHQALAAAYDLKGAFNNVSLVLERNANTAQVVQQLDRVLERYGGVGALQLVRDERDGSAQDHVEDPADDLPDHRGVSHQHDHGAPRCNRARPDRAHEGLRVLELRGGAALRQVRDRHRFRW
jgi:putative ABC transport system permease protein